MGKKEERGARAAGANERLRKAPRLESTDSGCGAAAIQGMSSPLEPCYHILAVEYMVDSVIEKIKSRDKAPMCEHCWLETIGRKKSAGSMEDPRKQQHDKPSDLITVCLECERCLCAGVGVETTDSKPYGHAWLHARKKSHWVALWFDQPHKAYCFSCERALCSNQSDRENEALESGPHTSQPDTDELCHVIRGIPNCGNTCYVNALVQCLLAVDKLRIWMLGPNAPMGSLGGALKELFVQTTPGNDAAAKLNPHRLLESLGALNARYAGRTMEDSQELLLDIRKGLNEEEKRQWPPKMRDRFPTVVDSIFLGQISSTLTCEKCLYDSPSHETFSELSLTLPSKGQTTKSVDSPQRSLAIEESNLKKVQTDATDKDKASEPSKTDLRTKIIRAIV